MPWQWMSWTFSKKIQGEVPWKFTRAFFRTTAHSSFKIVLTLDSVVYKLRSWDAIIKQTKKALSCLSCGSYCSSFVPNEFRVHIYVQNPFTCTKVFYIYFQFLNKNAEIFPLRFLSSFEAHRSYSSCSLICSSKSWVTNNGSAPN